jgi:hypothetical protein
VNLHAPRIFADRHFSCLRRLALAQSQSPIQLEAEKTFDRSLAAGGNDLFTLDLKTDQIVELKLEDQGRDVILSVYSPDRRLSRAFSSARQKGDALEFLASQPGRWELKVAAREGNAPASYKISDLKISTPHAPALEEGEVSPRIRKITNQETADAFWKEIGPNGSPLIEPIKDDPINRFTTFLWRAKLLQGSRYATCLKALRSSSSFLSVIESFSLFEYTTSGRSGGQASAGKQAERRLRCQDQTGVQ